jgi:hypothetical protein
MSPSSRARREQDDVEKLYAAGAAEVVPEALESSVMLATHALALSGIPMHKVIKRLREMREKHYSLLRGFFHGATDAGAHLADADQPRLHAVTLTPGAWAIGRHIADIDLAKVGAGVTAIRRRSASALKLEPDLELVEGDVVVLIGTAAAVTAGEELLLRAANKKARRSGLFHAGSGSVGLADGEKRSVIGRQDLMGSGGGGRNSGRSGYVLRKGAENPQGTGGGITIIKGRVKLPDKAALHARHADEEVCGPDWSAGENLVARNPDASAVGIARVVLVSRISRNRARSRSKSGKANVLPEQRCFVSDGGHVPGAVDAGISSRCHWAQSSGGIEIGVSTRIVTRQCPEAVLIGVDEGRDVSDVAGEVLHLGAVDQFLALEHAAQQQADDDQHDGDFDQGKTGLFASHDRLPFRVVIWCSVKSTSHAKT